MKPKIYNFKTHLEGKRRYGSVKKYRQAMKEIEDILNEANNRVMCGIFITGNRDRNK